MGYPPGMSGSDMCHVEGHIGKGNCSRCGDIDYGIMGYYGAVARWAKAWGITERETEHRFQQHYTKKHNVSS